MLVLGASGVVTVGASSGQTATIEVRELFGRRLSGHGNRFAPLHDRREAYERMAAHALTGEIVIDVQKLPPSKVRAAWALQAAAPHQKLTLVP